MTERLPFTAASLARAIKGVEKAGKRVVGVGPDGSLKIGEITECSPSIPRSTLQTDPFLAGLERMKNAEAQRKRKRVAT